jgi:hypothetical protein
LGFSSCSSMSAPPLSLSLLPTHPEVSSMLHCVLTLPCTPYYDILTALLQAQKAVESIGCEPK